MSQVQNDRPVCGDFRMRRDHRLHVRPIAALPTLPDLVGQFARRAQPAVVGDGGRGHMSGGGPRASHAAISLSSLLTKRRTVDSSRCSNSAISWKVCPCNRR